METRPVIISEVLAVLIEHRKAFTGVLIVLSMTGLYSLGKEHGKVPHVIECKEEIISLHEITEKKRALKAELVKCQTAKAGGQVLTCFDECDTRIRTALADAEAWACED